MKAVVLGAAGSMAAVAIKDLLESVGDIEITAADLRLIPHPDPRIQAERHHRRRTGSLEGCRPVKVAKYPRAAFAQFSKANHGCVP